MGRTPLFSRLSRLVTEALASSGAPRLKREELELSRRELLVGAAAASPALFACAAQSADPSSVTPPPSAPRVVVIGAGLAGLHCAYWLRERDVEVTVYEASQRVGGRVFTVRGTLPDGLAAELGGEFIDSSHAAMHFLADELGIDLDDRYADPLQRDELWWVKGNEVPAAKLRMQLADSSVAFENALRGADANTEKLRELDRTPLAVWLKANLVNQPELASILTTAYRGEFGLETDEQSALNLLFLIGYDTETSRLFEDSDARYHAREGNAAFAERLRERLGERIETGRRLVAVERAGDSDYTLTFETEARTGVQVKATHVVFALPFSVLKLVDLDRSGMSDLKREVIANLGYGTNSKIIGAVNVRWWQMQYGRSGRVTSDLPFQQVWDGSIGQAGTRGILTNFLGGEAGVDSDLGTAEERMLAVLRDLNQVFPNVSPTYAENTAIRMHWPSDPLFRGSYSCYRFGQWSTYSGREGQPEGNLYFCGEHCSVDFPRFMEGAVETGALTAARLLEDLELSMPPELEDLLKVKTLAPQPCYRAEPSTIFQPLTRRRRVLGANAAFVRTRRRTA